MVSERGRKRRQGGERVEARKGVGGATLRTPARRRVTSQGSNQYHRRCPPSVIVGPRATADGRPPQYEVASATVRDDGTFRQRRSDNDDDNGDDDHGHEHDKQDNADLFDPRGLSVPAVPLLAPLGTGVYAFHHVKPTLHPVFVAGSPSIRLLVPRNRPKLILHTLR